MIRSSVIRQLLALRSAALVVVEQADAVLAACDEDEAKPAPVEPAEPAGCKHTSDLREDTTTGGGSQPSYFCRGCKRTSDEIAADENGDD